VLTHPDVVSESCIALEYVSLVALQAAPPVLLAALYYFLLAPKHIIASLLRIRDVYPGSRISDPGSKNSYKREG
jgi:hypothetical protein